MPESNAFPYENNNFIIIAIWIYVKFLDTFFWKDVLPPHLNYYENVINSEDNDKPIGIILCAEKDKIALEYAFEDLSNNIFASTYKYYIPNKEQLISEVQKVLDNNE